jgi:hypothetical protein
MAPIVQFIRPHDAYDPETPVFLDGVYDKALASLGGQPTIVRETIALRMFDFTSKGGRDPERLRQAALRPLCSRL